MAVTSTGSTRRNTPQASLEKKTDCPTSWSSVRRVVANTRRCTSLVMSRSPNSEYRSPITWLPPLLVVVESTSPRRWHVHASLFSRMDISTLVIGVELLPSERATSTISTVSTSDSLPAGTSRSRRAVTVPCRGEYSDARATSTGST